MNISQAPARCRAGHRRRNGSLSPIWAAARRCVRSRTAAASKARMGFTALDGLPMGTRPGQIDPGVMLYLISEKGHVARRRCRICFTGSAASRAYRASATTCASLRRAATRARHLRSTILFTAPGCMRGCWRRRCRGSTPSYLRRASAKTPPRIRAAIAEKLGWLGAVARCGRQRRNTQLLISTPDSRVAVYVVPTDEELMIARHTLSLLSNEVTPAPKSSERVS